jgi:hypothetical protein
MKPTIARKDIAKPPRVPLWRNRDYMLLWSGQTVSLVGTVISQTAFPLLVWDLTHSAAAALRFLSDLSSIDHSQSVCSSCTFAVRGTIRLTPVPKNSSATGSSYEVGSIEKCYL